MAAGMAVLGGLVAGPALAIFGCIVGAKASAKLDQAKSNLAKARKVAEELKTATEALNFLTTQAKMFLSMTNKMCEIFLPQLDDLVSIVNEHGTDYMKFPVECQNRVVVTVSTYQVLRALVDARIMKEDGSFDPKSEKVLEFAQKYLEAS